MTLSMGPPSFLEVGKHNPVGDAAFEVWRRSARPAGHLTGNCLSELSTEVR